MLVSPAGSTSLPSASVLNAEALFLSIASWYPRNDARMTYEQERARAFGGGGLNRPPGLPPLTSRSFSFSLRLALPDALFLRPRLTHNPLSGTLPATYVDDPIPAHWPQERRVVPHGRA